MKLSSKLVLTSLMSVILLSGCGFNPTKDAVIMINDTPITKQQYEKEFNELAGNPMFKQMGVDLKADPNGYVNLMLKDRVVNELIVRALLDNEMKKRHIEVKDKDIQEEMKSIIDKVGSKDKFNEILKQNGVTASQFKKDLKEEVKIKKLVESMSLVMVTDDMTKKYYNNNLDKFKYPDKVRASHILISADPERIKEVIMSQEDAKTLTPAQIDKKVEEDMAAKLQKAQKLLAEAKKNPANFASLAKENSDDPGSATQGGDLGYFTADQMVESFSKAAFAAKPSTITDLVKSPYGYHIILVKDRIAAGTEPYEKVKEEIKAFLENQEKVKVLQKFLADAKKNAKITYVDASFNPDTIQSKIKEQAKKNPMLQGMQQAPAQK